MANYEIHPSFPKWEGPDAFNRVFEFNKPDDLDIDFKTIHADEPDREIEIKIYRPKAEKPLPIIMNIHGGGFVGGNYENDNNRVTYLAMNIPAIIVSLNYRLAPEFTFPAALMDCYAVWNWIHKHADELEGNGDKMGLYGTSAGGNMCAGLAFYVRDHGGPKITLNGLNTPCLGLGPTLSAEQRRHDGAIITGHNLALNVRLYMGANGQPPSYYAVPNTAIDYSGLPPTLVIAAEHDPLRDESWQYVQNLLKDAVPVEFYLVPRAVHGFTAVKCDITDWVNQGTAMSYRREFSKN